MKKAIIAFLLIAAAATQFWPDYDKPEASKGPYSINVEANATLSEILDN